MKVIKSHHRNRHTGACLQVMTRDSHTLVSYSTPRVSKLNVYLRVVFVGKVCMKLVAHLLVWLSLLWVEVAFAVDCTSSSYVLRTQGQVDSLSGQA